MLDTLVETFFSMQDVEVSLLPTSRIWDISGVDFEELLTIVTNNFLYVIYLFLFCCPYQLLM